MSITNRAAERVGAGGGGKLPRTPTLIGPRLESEILKSVGFLY
jgi:hypothetical protein